MPSSYSLGGHFETFIQNQLSSGRYANASEVLRDALRLMEERERRFATLDASIENRMTALRAGRSKPAEEIFDRLEAKYTKMAEERGL